MSCKQKVTSKWEPKIFTEYIKSLYPWHGGILEIKTINMPIKEQQRSQRVTKIEKEKTPQCKHGLQICANKKIFLMQWASKKFENCSRVDRYLHLRKNFTKCEHKFLYFLEICPPCSLISRSKQTYRHADKCVCLTGEERSGRQWDKVEGRAGSWEVRRLQFHTNR